MRRVTVPISRAANEESGQCRIGAVTVRERLLGASGRSFRSWCSAGGGEYSPCDVASRRGRENAAQKPQRLALQNVAQQVALYCALGRAQASCYMQISCK